VVAKAAGKQVGVTGRKVSGTVKGSPPARAGSSPKLVAAKPTRSRSRRRTLERQYVAIDLHLNRSVVEVNPCRRDPKRDPTSGEIR
jgi:hypothetical protein